MTGIVIGKGKKIVATKKRKLMSLDDFNDNYFKVGITVGGAMHNNDPLRKGDWTLCGRPFFFSNHNGTKYCAECQRVLAKRRSFYVGDSR